MSSEQGRTVSVCYGKYTFVYYGEDRVDVLRHDAPWVAILGGSRAVAQMMYELEAARVVVRAARAAGEGALPGAVLAALARHDSLVGDCESLGSTPRSTPRPESSEADLPIGPDLWAAGAQEISGDRDQAPSAGEAPGIRAQPAQLLRWVVDRRPDLLAAHGLCALPERVASAARAAGVDAGCGACLMMYLAGFRASPDHAATCSSIPAIRVLVDESPVGVSGRPRGDPGPGGPILQLSVSTRLWAWRVVEGEAEVGAARGSWVPPGQTRELRLTPCIAGLCAARVAVHQGSAAFRVDALCIDDYPVFPGAIGAAEAGGPGAWSAWVSLPRATRWDSEIYVRVTNRGVAEATFSATVELAFGTVGAAPVTSTSQEAP